MPLFEYKCPLCGKIFEEYVKKFDDDCFCPDCECKAEKNYSGKIYTGTGETSHSCSGNCATCKGCGK